MDKSFYVCLLLYFTFSLALFLIVFEKEPQVIMDEQFHIHQSQNYCSGSFQWDPKITTLPGLYWAATGAIKFLEIVSFRKISCTIFNLRFFNLICSIGNFIMFYLILGKKYPDLPESKRIISTLNLSLFPLLYFFTFLFYTEPLSTFLLLTMHFLWTSDKFFTSAIFGALSVLTRQTNIVWVLFHGIMTLYGVLNDNPIFRYYMENLLEYVDRKETLKHNNNNNLEEIEPAKTYFPGQYRTPCDGEITYSNSVRLLKELTNKCGSYILVGLSFAVFMVINNGIVVGDREAHKVNLNSPQILYFSLFTGFFCFSLILHGRGRKVITFIRNHLLITLLVSIVFFLSVCYNTQAHYYNLGDSHHIVNIIFNPIFNSAVIRYALLPFYVFFCTFIVISLLENTTKFFTGTFILITILNLGLQLLLEFRYFIPPFLFFRLNISVTTWKEICCEFILFSVVTATVFWLFLSEPIRFDSNDPSKQIIIW